MSNPQVATRDEQAANVKRLVQAATAVLDDLERYARRSGPGPDERLLELSRALSTFETERM